ncbi:helix-turn-helix transcriptional regulator [Flagellimonas hymeniacidonis]|uniref:Helix-turn-helix transcriptional regulator n=1 Tax=Flagellimonas hymeniacidonis TaxID=2603628 RepID=A0A5C8V3V1_9FLAO|nr:metalloregulator ArsR/SmtB family transcription factor [Flagellimonas hymeniacidonis]TXN36066.1 helix-turn-helix transcriptional regulator [Flagellimonas hymeniacidonis]
MSSKETINKVFKAVSDPTRREVFHVLMAASAAMSIAQITEHFEISRQGVTKHIKLLEEAGLVKTFEKGRERFCESNPTPLNEIRNWLLVYDKFWDDKIKSLDKFLTQRPKK